MKIVILTGWFSEGMGYIENCLPPALARLGHEVHVISSTAQVYYNTKDYKSVYEPFLGKNILEEGSRSLDGFMLHRLSFSGNGGTLRIRGLGKLLGKIRPDVVQVFDPFSFLTAQAAWYRLRSGCRLFTANHTVASVFSLYQPGKGSILHRIFFFFSRTIPGMLVGSLTSRSYPATVDALEIAVRYMGVPRRKARLASLGVDTHRFCPAEVAERKRLREELGITEDEILCIYTGRFTESKNPLCLADAVALLRSRGAGFRALFMGNGPQESEITKRDGCMVRKFVPYHKLPSWYQRADIGVWPRQESTSMIDAAACGLPILVSERVQAKERYDGNGLTYRENDSQDMADKLIRLALPRLRRELGEAGARKMREQYSWDRIARDRAEDYISFLKKMSDGAKKD